MLPVLHIDRIDHIVLTVRDIAVTCRFYTQILGMREITFNGSRKALAFGHRKINLHAVGHELHPKAQRPVTGSADLCLTTTTPIADVMTRLRAHGVEIIEGPVRRDQSPPSISWTLIVT